MLFNDRKQAGALLVEKLSSFRGSSVVVIGLARGGVVVASRIASDLPALLDVLVVKKIPSPLDSELAIGALTEEGVFYINWKLAHRLSADEDYVNRQIRTLADQIKQKTILYKKGRKPIDVRGKTVILVDDGVATGATMIAAKRWCKKKHAKKIIVALPVLSYDRIGIIRREVDELIYLDAPNDFSSVGQWYKQFDQVEDREVIKLLRRDANQRMHANATNKKRVYSYH
ncbi:phosphoribosyltransferase [Candidatus Gottesmanbacteria bacterium]|nr:phosphoribosyltransferase [Candidatus Gottesmanbacteria bacterium]